MNWRFLEALRGLTAVPAVWLDSLGPDYQSFKALCLQVEDWQVDSYPCPRECGCWHQVILRHDQAGAVGACCCTPPACPDIPLSLTDITPLKLNRPKLSRELCRALSLAPKFFKLPPANTVQIGSWSAEATPVILTIQNDYDELRFAIAELGMRLHNPFILLAPTSHLLTAPCHELLAHAHAGFFPLDSTVLLTDHGTLEAAKPPGELFAKFTPQPKELPEDVAARAFALVQQLEPGPRTEPPSPLTVFRLYCIEGLSAAEIARRCRSTIATVLRRLNLIHAKTGVPLAQLRRISPHLAKIEDAATDPRAAHIHRKRLIDDNDDPTEPED